MGKFKVGQVYDPQFEKLPPSEIVLNLEGISYDIVVSEYTQNLTPQQLTQKRAELAEAVIKLKEIENRKKKAMEEFKAEASKPKSDCNELLDVIKHKSERVYGKLFMIDDQEEGLMYFFNEHAICVDVRAMLPSEKQIRLKAINHE